MTIAWRIGNTTRVGEIISETSERFMVRRYDPVEGEITEPVLKSFDYTLGTPEPVRVTFFTHGGARPGAGRNQVSDPVVQCPWGIPGSDMEKFKRIAEGKRLKPSDLLRSIINQYINDQIHSS